MEQRYDFNSNGGVLKLTVLAQEVDAALAADPLSDAVATADRAYWAEFDAARALEAKFHAQFSDDEEAADSGLCNARDTYPASVYPNAERSTEFWGCAIASAELIQDEAAAQRARAA